VISQELKVQMHKIYLPIFIGQTAALVLELLFKFIRQPPPFSRRSLDFFVKHNAYSIAKAQSKLNYQPQVDLVMGIQKTLKSTNTSWT
jgi:hypothetical protein